LSIVDNNALNVRNTTTFEAWIYPVGWGEGSTGRIFDKNQTTAYAFLITNTSSNIQQIRVYFGNSVYYSDNYTISLNSWQHVVVTFDVSLSSEQVKIYVNGIQRGVGTRTSTIPVNSESLYIGNRAGLDRTFNGIIDEVRIYNRALSQEEINASYNNGLYRLHNKFTNLPTGTYSYYAYAIDAFGNLGKSETRTVTLNYLYGCNVNPGRILSDPTWNSNEYRDLSANKLSCDAIRIWPWNGWKYSDLESIGSWAASKDIKIEPVLVTDIATFNISGFPDDLTTSKANFTTFVNNLKTNARSFYDQIYAWDVNNEPNLGNTNELNWVKNMLNYVYSENNSHLVTVGIGKQRTMKHDLQLIAAYENISSVHFYYPAIDRGADCSACTPLSKVCNSTCACYFTLSMFPVDVNLTWFINDIVKTDLITAGVPNQQIDIQEFGTPICPKDGYGCTDIATQGQWFNTFFTTIQDLKDAGDTQIRNLFFWQLKGACGIPFGVINDTDFSLYPAGSVIADFYR
jgi:hypothetical protein